MEWQPFFSTRRACTAGGNHFSAPHASGHGVAAILAPRMGGHGVQPFFSTRCERIGGGSILFTTPSEWTWGGNRFFFAPIMGGQAVATIFQHLPGGDRRWQPFFLPSPDSGDGVATIFFSTEYGWTGGGNHLFNTRKAWTWVATKLFFLATIGGQGGDNHYF